MKACSANESRNTEWHAQMGERPLRMLFLFFCFAVAASGSKSPTDVPSRFGMSVRLFACAQDRDGYCYDVKEGLPWRSILFFLVGKIATLHIGNVMGNRIGHDGVQVGILP